MKGTNIKVVNDCVFEELEKAEKSRAVLKKILKNPLTFSCNHTNIMIKG